MLCEFLCRSINRAILHILQSKMDGPGDRRELQPGDVVSAISGDQRVVLKVETDDVVDLPVYNLTVENDHTFAVGSAGILVHNSAWCNVLEKLKGNATALKALAKVHGFKERMIHAHHIVLKTIPKRYLWVVGKELAEVKLRGAGAVRAWKIWKSQEYLKTYGIGLLDNMDDAMALAKSGQPLDNLAWAINGSIKTKRGTPWYDHGIHGEKYVDAVHKGLKKIVGDGVKNNRSSDAIAKSIRQQPEKWRIELEAGRQFWY